MSATGSNGRRLRSQSTSMSYQSPAHPSSKRAFPAPASPRDIGPRGKRARTGASPSPSSFPAPNPSEFSGFPFVPIPLEPVATNLASSAPAMPLLPASSAAFFPASRTSSSHDLQSPSPTSLHHTSVTLDDLHREAFTSLRQSLARSGEGFVRRMRDWERRRVSESNNVSMLGAQEKGRGKPGSRSSRTSHTDHRAFSGMPANHLHENHFSFTTDVSHMDIESGDMSAYKAFLNGRDDADVEDDMQIDGISRSLPLAPPGRKAGRASLREPIDIPCSPELFAVELAEGDAENYSTQYASTFDLPFTYSNTRSSSPFSLGNTSDDESSAGSRNDQAYSGFSSPRTMSNPVDWFLQPVSTRSQPVVSLHPGEHTHQISPSASPRPSSHTHLFAPRHMIDDSVDDIPAHIHLHIAADADTSSQVPQTASDEGLAALVLALANGSGSLADYGYVREAQGELEELQAGALWE